MREVTDPAGGFYSTQDVDSEREEGKLFVWALDEIREVLGEAADALMTAYGVTRNGNFAGRTILEFVGETMLRRFADSEGGQPHPTGPSSNRLFFTMRVRGGRKSSRASMLAQSNCTFSRL
ncbi:MAG: hypothetical protein PVH59_14295 [Anaerolineae bacterium]